jgi:DNA primase
MRDWKCLNLALPAHQVAEMLGLECHAYTGRWWRGRCPFHQSGALRSRSMQINCVLRLYYCHRCHRSGDLIDLVARVTGVSMYVAAERLATEFAIW